MFCFTNHKFCAASAFAWFSWLLLTGFGAGLCANEPCATVDTWPCFRGCLEGSGTSAVLLPDNPQLIWKKQFGKTAFEATPVIAGGIIYIGDLDGTFHAMQLKSGELLWEVKNEAGWSAAAAVTEKVVITGDMDGVVHAFDRIDGSLIWSHHVGGEVSGGPSILGTRVLIGAQDATLSCLSITDGKVQWTHTIGDQIRCTPTVAGGKVFLAGCDGKLHVIDVEHGKAIGQVSIDGPTGTTPATAKGRAFFGSEGGAFWAIDYEKLEVAWKVVPAVGGQAYRSSAAVAEGIAVVGSRARAVEAFATFDGSRRWRFATRGRVDSSPVIVGSRVFVGDTAGKIFALDISSGKLSWEFDAGVGFSSSPAVAAGCLVMAS